MTNQIAHPEWLVESDWLAAHLDDPRLRIFDCTTHLRPDPATVYRVEAGRTGYQERHIPGAGFIDIQADLSDNDSPLRFTQPSAAAFAAAAGEAIDSFRRPDRATWMSVEEFYSVGNVVANTTSGLEDSPAE